MRARPMRRMRRQAMWVGAALLGCASANASVAVLLEQPYGKMGHLSPTGHSAIYLDHVCADSPTRLRACGPGELGVVISRYDGIDHLDWVAMPLTAYLYAVDSPGAIPGSVDRGDEAALRDAYRRAHLEAIAPDTDDGGAPAGNWYELVGASYDRTIYGFGVKTTAEQDAALIAEFNDRKNVEMYNGFFNNCADFSRVVLNRFYPHAVRRNYIADLGLTSPKAVARGITHYARKHPEVELRVFTVPQVKGSIPRSYQAVGLAEGLVKKYGVPLTVISPETTAVMLLAYIGHGRFAMPKDAVVMDLQDAATTAFLEEKPFASIQVDDAVMVQETPVMLTAGSVD